MDDFYTDLFSYIPDMAFVKSEWKYQISSKREETVVMPLLRLMYFPLFLEYMLVSDNT